MCFFKRSLILIVLFASLSGVINADLGMQVIPGFDGYQKYDRWLYFHITLTSTHEELEGEVIVEVHDGSEVRRAYSVPVALHKNAKKTYYLYCLPEIPRRNINIRLADADGKTILQEDIQLVGIASGDLLVAVISRDSAGLEFTGEGQTGKTYFSYPSLESLPDSWKGYDSVDVVLLGNILPERFSEGQRKAITDWICGGGTLVVSGGTNSQNLMGTFIERLLPVKIGGTKVVNSLSSLNDAVKDSMVVASSEITGDGRAIYVESDGLPVVAEKTLGNGKVIFLAFDYRDPVLQSWSGRERFWDSILPIPEIRKEPKYSSIARLLSTASFLSLPLYKFIGAFLALYVICFSLINYFVLKKSGRSGWIWSAVPSIIAIFILGSLGFNYLTSGRKTVVNDFSVVEVYQDIKRAKVSSYFGIFSPPNKPYSIDFPRSGDFFVNPMLVQDVMANSYFKLVENDVYKLSFPQLKSLAPQLFFGECYVNFDGSISDDLHESSKGRLISSLPFDLYDCYVFSNGNHERIGELKRRAQAEISISKSYSGDILNSYLPKDEEMCRFINIIKPVFSVDPARKTLIGWIEGSALKTLTGMDLGLGHDSSGKILVVMQL